MSIFHPKSPSLIPSKTGVTPKDLMRIAGILGFEFIRQTGDHRMYEHPMFKLRMIITLRSKKVQNNCISTLRIAERKYRHDLGLGVIPPLMDIQLPSEPLGILHTHGEPYNTPVIEEKPMTTHKPLIDSTTPVEPVPFRQWIKTLREEHNLTQKSLGELIDTVSSTIACIERGEINPLPDTIEKYRTLFGGIPAHVIMPPPATARQLKSSETARRWRAAKKNHEAVPVTKVVDDHIDTQPIPSPTKTPEPTETYTLPALRTGGLVDHREIFGSAQISREELISKANGILLNTFLTDEQVELLVRELREKAIKLLGL